MTLRSQRRSEVSDAQKSESFSGQSRSVVSDAQGSKWFSDQSLIGVRVVQVSLTFRSK